MSTLKTSRLILLAVFLFVTLAAGYASRHYYNHLCKSERLNYLELRKQLKDRVYVRVQRQWERSITDVIAYAQRMVYGSSTQISKGLKVIVESQKEVRRAFYINNEMIYLPQWKKFRMTKSYENLSLSISDNPEFIQAEILEFQYEDYEEAVKIYEHFWLENPDNFQAANALARCLYKLRKLDRAEKIYRQIFTQNPTIQIQGDIPLSITAAFQLLSIYQAQGNSDTAMSFGYSLYVDFLDEKWELAKSKSDFFKKKIQVLLNRYMADHGFADKFQNLMRREREVEGIKEDVRFISTRVIPFIEGSYISQYRVYFLSSKQAEPNFLLIVPHRNGYLVLDIDYAHFVQSRLLGLLETLAQDNHIGLQLHYANTQAKFSEVPLGQAYTFSVSKNFPDMILELVFSDQSKQDLETYLRKAKLYFIIGYSLFVATLSLIFFVLMKQIQFAELKSDFVSHVSHELKTPLTSLRMFSEMLCHHRRLLPEKRQQYYTIMHSESVRLSRLIENLLDISRIEKKKSQFYFKAESINVVLHTAADIFVSSLEHKRRRLKLKLGRDIKMLVDKDAIIQMVLNVLDNARKFSPENKPILLRSMLADDKLVLCIKDQGVGMTRGEIRKVFRKFYQVKKTYEEKFKGVGLGLAIVKNIVQAHRGKIFIDSEKNLGTLVTIRLPIRATSIRLNEPGKR